MSKINNYTKSNTQVQVPGELLIESSIDVMIAIGMKDTIIEWNSAASVLFNHKREQAIGNSLFDLLPTLKNDSDLQTAIKSAAGGKKSFLPACSAFPHRKQVETHVIPLRKGTSVDGILLLIHDVSHRIIKELELRALNEELQSKLKQLNCVRAELVQITQIASHNIREPLRLIYTSVEFLLSTEAGSMTNSGKALFRRIQASLNRINLLLDDIITLTQIDIADSPAVIVKMTELVSEMKMKFARRLQDSKTQLTIGRLCDIRAHRNQVLLLLQHIVSNVIKFTNDGQPQIHLNCETIKYDPKNDGHDKKPGDYYLLSITHNSTAFDNLDPSPTLYVNDNNETRSYTGPAIAITLAAKIMEVHSGFIFTEKLANGDSRIKCYFPAEHPEHPKLVH